MSQGWKPRGIPTVLEVYGRQFLIWEDIDNKFFRACLAEFMAMHLFVLLWYYYYYYYDIYNIIIIIAVVVLWLH